MHRRAERSPQARRDVIELADYIAQNNFDAALRFLEAIDDTFRFLAANPGAGQLCRFGNAESQQYRVWPVNGFRNYLVVFRPTEKGIAVERVLHGSRNIDAIFGAD